MTKFAPVIDYGLFRKFRKFIPLRFRRHTDRQTSQTWSLTKAPFPLYGAGLLNEFAMST